MNPFSTPQGNFAITALSNLFHAKKMLRTCAIAVSVMFCIGISKQSNAQVTSNFTASFNWPSWAGENCFYVIAPDGTQIGCYCATGNCWNGANVSYITGILNLSTLVNQCGNYTIRRYDQYGDGWNSTGTVTLYCNNTLVGTYGNTCTGAGCTQDATFTIPGLVQTNGYRIAAEGATLPSPTTPSGCGTGQVAVGSGAYRDAIAISPNTYYNLSWSALPANINAVQIVSNGTGGTVTGNNTNWFSGTSTLMNVQASRGKCGWIATSAVLTYNRVTPATPSAITGSTPVCSGSSNTYSVTSVTSLYNWTYVAGGAPAPSGTSNSITFNPTSSGTLTVFANNDGCVSAASSTKAITVNTLSTAPTGTSVLPTAICTGGTSTLTPSGGTLGTGASRVWYAGSACGAFTQDWVTQPYSTSGTTVNSDLAGILNVTSTDGDPMINMYNTLGSFDPSIYRFINVRYKVNAGTAGNCEIFFTNSTYTVPTGAVDLATGSLISDGAWHVLSIDMPTANANWLSGGNITGWRFDWATNTGVTMDIDYISLTTSAPFSSTSVSPTSTTTYFVRNEGECNTTACAPSSTVTVSADPVWATNSFSPASGSTVCIGGGATFSASFSGGLGGSMAWIRSGTSGGAGTTVTSVNTPVSTGTYYYRPQYTASVSGCDLADGTESNLTVAVDPTWATNTFSPSSGSTICTGGSVTFSASVNGAQGGTVAWVRSTTSGGSGTAVTSGDIPPSTGTFYYRPQYTPGANGCDLADGTERSIVVAVDPTWATNTFSPTSGSTICIGGAVTFSASVNGAQGGTVAWVRSTTPGGSGTAVTTGDIPPSTGTFYYRPQYTPGANGCNVIDGTESSVVVAVDPTWATNTFSPTSGSTVCSGAAVSFSATVSGAQGGTVAWVRSTTPGGAGTAVTSGDIPPSTGTFYYRPQYTPGLTGCNLADGTESSVVVVADPNVTTHPVNASFCIGGTYSPFIVASGGTPSLSYEWKYSTDNSTFNTLVAGTPSGAVYTNANSANTFSVSGINTAGTYYYACFVTSSGADCDASQSNSGTLTVYPDPTFTTTPSDVLCFGGTSGSIQVTVTVGTSLFDFSKNAGGTYAGSSGQTSPYTFTGLSAGSYDIVVRDAHNCVSQPVASIVINEPANSPSFTETHTAVLCNGGSTGTITVTATGGTAGYTYSKDGGSSYQVSNIFTGLSQGTYGVRVKDANGCQTAINNVVITQPSVLSFTPSQTNVVCNGDNNGTITLNGAGGVAPYEYSDDNGSTYLPGSDPYTFTGLSPAVYQVGIKDANACFTSFSPITITEPGVLSFTESHVNATCNGGNNGSITVSATGGTTPYRYSKNNGGSFQLGNVFNGLTAGTYDIVVKDDNNCITSATTVTITAPTAVTFTTANVHVLCNGDNTGSITITAGGGTPGYTYSNDNGSNYQASNVFNNLYAGSYLVKVQDINGCNSSISNIQITEPTLVTYTTSYTHVNCNGAGDGTITIDGNGGVPPYLYTINGGGTYQFGPDPFTFNNLAPATYSAGLVDANGCVKGFTNITIIQPTAVSFTTSKVDVLCFGGNNASITVSASGGTGTFTYSKDNGVTFQSSNLFNSLIAGTYQIRVKDASGCVTAAQSVTINQPVTGLTVTASNGSPYSTAVTANLYSTPAGGTPGYTYNWSGPAGFATNPAHTLQNPTRTPTTVNMTGTYKVTVTDANGCSASAQTIMSVYDGYVWIGAVSTDWNDNSNWSFQVPDYPDDCTQKAYIQSGTPFAPTVNIPGLTVGAITLVNGAVLTLNNDLTLCSNLVGSATSLVSNVTGIGTFIMKSIPSVVQTITGKTKFDATLQIDNSAGVNITSAATQVANALELKTGVLSVSASNFLVFVSNSSNHSAIIDNFSPGMTGSISGSVTMQRRYDAPTSPSYKTQHYMGSPVDQPLYTAFGANGTEGRVVNTTCDEKKSSSGSPVGNMAKFDENCPDAAVCNLQGWYIVKTGNTENARGYSVSRTGAGLLSITGAPNQGTSYTRTSLTNSGWSNMTLQGHRDTSGWHILSNPWLANLELSLSGGAGMDNQVAVWQTTGPYAGGYRYYQVGFEPVDIAPFQAFLVHKTAVGGTATFTINGADRVRTPSSVHFHSMNNDQELTVYVDNASGLRDMAIVAFNSQATNSFDPIYDGNKLWGDPDRLSLYSENNGMPMARNTLASINSTSTVPVGFDAGLPGTFTMSFEGLNSFDATSYIGLEDKKTNTWYNVRNGNYVFSGDTTDNLNRFVLHFTPAAVISHTDATCNSTGVIHAEQAGTSNWNYSLADNNGTVISNGTLNQNTPLTVNANAGVYTLTLVDNYNYTVVKQIQINGFDEVQSSFAVSSNTVEQDDDVSFTSTSTNASGHIWNFGDNTTATGTTALHSYTSPGVYSATLTSDNVYCNDISTQQITVTAKSATGIHSITDKSGINIWSNDNTVYVDFAKQPKVEATIEIYNVLGQQLSNEKFGRSSIYRKQFNNLEAAYVVVRVKNNDDITTKKVFIASH